MNENSGGDEFLRPFLLSLEHEDEDMVIRVNNAHMDEIMALHPAEIIVQDKKVVMDFRVLPCMHDGKEITILTKDILRYSASDHKINCVS